MIKTGRLIVPDAVLSAGEGNVSVDESNDPETEVDDSLEAAVSLERDMQSYLISRVGEIEPGLSLVENGVEYPTAVGRIDLLARDSSGRLVVIELKAGRARDGALGQLLGYIGCFLEAEPGTRGILIASSFDQRLTVAARGLSHVRLLAYRVSFRLEEVRADV